MTTGDSKIWRRPTVSLTVILALNCAALLWLGWYSYTNYRETKATRARYIRTATLRGEIMHLDEVLTMSARMAAATGDPQWEERYRRNEENLDSAIKEAIQLAPEAYGSAAAVETDAANIKLVEMENQAFGLVRAGQDEQARSILFSDEYQEQKRIYAQGMFKFSEALLDISRTSLLRIRRRAVVQIGAVGLLIPCLIAGWLIVFRAERGWESTLTEHNRLLVEQADEIASAHALLAQTYDDLERLDKMKSAFIDIISHELATPVTCIVGMLSVIQRRMPEMDADLHQALDAALRGSHRLEGLLARILQIVEAGDYEKGLVKEQTALPEFFQRVTQDVKPFADLRGQSLLVDLPENLPPVSIDREKIRDVYLNLLMNAVKFTPDGGRIEVHCQVRPDRQIEISVSDNGVGISEEDKPHVFDDFFTSFDTLKHSSGQFEFERRGIGLGLAIVAMFVRMHRGEFGLESAPGKGARFWFTLPAQSEAA